MDNSTLKLDLHPNFKPHSLIICKDGSLTNIFNALTINQLQFEAYHQCFKTTDIVTNNVSSQFYDKDMVMNYLSQMISADLLFFASVDSFTRAMNLIEPYLMSYISLRQQFPKSALTANFLSSHLTKTNLSSKSDSEEFKHTFRKNLVTFFKDFLWLTPGQITQNVILSYFQDKGCGCNSEEIKKQLVGEFKHGVSKLGYQAALCNWLMHSFMEKGEDIDCHTYKLAVLGNAQSTVKYDLITKHTLHDLFLDDLIKIEVTNLPLYSTEFDANDFISYLRNYLEDYECQCSVNVDSSFDQTNLNSNLSSNLDSNSDSNPNSNNSSSLNSSSNHRSVLKFNASQPHILFVSQSKIAELLLLHYPQYLRYFDYMIFLHGSSDLSSVLSDQYSQVYPQNTNCAVETLSGFQANFKRFRVITKTNDDIHNTTDLPDLILPINLDISTLKDITLYLNSRVR